MIGVYGISYRSASADIRERYAFGKEEIPLFLKGELLCSQNHSGNTLNLSLMIPY